MDFVLSVWREACRHIELENSMDRIARLMPPHLPADAMLVRGLNYAQSRLETVAVGLCRSASDAVPRTVSTCTPEQLNTVLDWCRRGTILHGRRNDEPLLEMLAPPDIDGDWLAGPLIMDDHPMGVLLLLARPPRIFASH